jgi:hypothetical protein
MKQANLAFLTILTALLLSTCGSGYPVVTVTNNSTYTVTFTYRDTITLTSGETAVTEKGLTQGLPVYDQVQKVEASSPNYRYIEFKNRPYRTVKVNNTLTDPASLSAGIWMDEIVIAASATGSGTIYGDDLNFTVTTPSYPARAVWELKCDPTCTSCACDTSCVGDPACICDPLTKTVFVTITY